MPEVFDIYKALWKHAEELGAYVQYEHWMLMNRDMVGEFTPPEFPSDLPHIWLRRDYFASPEHVPSVDRAPNAEASLPPPNLLDELITLAHEYGHFISWRDETPAHEYARYRAACEARSRVWSEATDGDDDGDPWQLRRNASNRLSLEHRELIVAEETRAWRIGRRALEERGFAAWSLFDKRAEGGVERHRYWLALTDVFPDDGPSE